MRRPSFQFRLSTLLWITLAVALVFGFVSGVYRLRIENGPMNAANDRDGNQTDPPKRMTVTGDALAAATEGPDDKRPKETQDRDTDAAKAAETGLQYLASRQNDDGGFGPDLADEDWGRDVGVVGLAGMAFLSSGSMPGNGPYGVQLEKCVRYLLAHANDDGFITEPSVGNHHPMASHALAVMFLARCYAEPPRRELERVVETAVDEIARSQNDDGGWSYEPLKGDSAVPVTVCQVAALDAARRSGCQVPPELFDRAPGFLIRCQNPDGGFKNTLTDGASAYDRTAAAVAALQIASPPDSQALAAGLAFLNADLDLAVHAQSDSFFVDCLFVAWVLPRVDEQHRSAWYSALRSELMRRREDDGSWRDNLGRERATAIACMALLLPQTTSEGSTPSSDIPESTYRLVPQTYQAGKNNDTPPAIRPANLFHPNGTRRSGVLVR